MNEFSAKKIGEGLAFTNVSNKTFEKGYEGFRKLFMDVKLDALKKENTECYDELLNIAKELKVEDITLSKALATEEKLLSMRDLYVKDEWDNITELCEWLGFFEGAAIVHWALVETSVLESGLNDLSDFAREIGDFHKKILEDFLK